MGDEAAYYLTSRYCLYCETERHISMRFIRPLRRVSGWIGYGLNIWQAREKAIRAGFSNGAVKWNNRANMAIHLLPIDPWGLANAVVDVPLEVAAIWSQKARELIVAKQKMHKTIPSSITDLLSRTAFRIIKIFDDGIKVIRRRSSRRQRR